MFQFVIRHAWGVFSDGPLPLADLPDKTGDILYMKKRILSFVLCLMMAASLPAGAWADEEDVVMAQRDRNEERLYEAQGALDELAVRKADVQNKIKELNWDLADLMIEISLAEENIKVTESKISETQKKIEKTAASLKKAKKRCNSQYAAMKKRIQYIYENGGDVGLAIAIIESKDVTQFLNKAEYAEQIEGTDRDQLESLKKTVRRITRLKKGLKKTKEDLVTQKGYLTAQKKDLNTQKEDLNTKIAEKQADSDEYDWQIDFPSKPQDL